ncbi:MAG: helix-turn-helix transcriptional regulator [Syntrophomonadaceae bacterium]|nr:helix-turn-helix transcriptional regulator [Syntrophomonadaceae bacterium]
MENRLRKLRDEAGMTQEDLAARVGVSRQTIISLEKGKYNPSIFLAFKLARAFALSIEEVFIYCEEGEIK